MQTIQATASEQLETGEAERGRRVLAALRAETGPHHERLERRLALVGEALSRGRYRDILAAFYGLYRPLEERLGPIVSAALGEAAWRRRRKIERLEDDLRALGLDDRAIAALPRCRELPEPCALDQALGCLYVVEGASLGGQVIVRHVAPRLHVTPEAGAAFFYGYGAATGAMWRDLLALLGERVSPEGEAAVVATASATFLAFERWLERAGVLVE